MRASIVLLSILTSFSYALPKALETCREVSPPTPKPDEQNSNNRIEKVVLTARSSYRKPCPAVSWHPWEIRRLAVLVG